MQAHAVAGHDLAEGVGKKGRQSRQDCTKQLGAVAAGQFQEALLGSVGVRLPTGDRCRTEHGHQVARILDEPRAPIELGPF